MGSPRFERALELQAALTELLAADNRPDVTVTLDLKDVVSASRHGVILIQPPDLDFTTFTATDYAWELDVFAGPAGNVIAAWETLDDIIEVLRAAGVEIDTAKPIEFQPQNGPAIGGYALTLTEQFID